MEQTAVEWLEDFMNNGKQKSEGIISLAFSKAKEMEKEIIRTAYLDGMDGEYTTSQQYYKETYEKD